MKDFVCKNCGQCCGPVPISEEERKRIVSYLQKHHDIRIKAKQKDFSFVCVFRDENKGCLIYRCRPNLCRKFICTSEEWKKEMRFLIDYEQFKKNSPRLINECFGDDRYKEKYKELLTSIENAILKK